MYVEEIRDGEIIPNAKPEILLDTPTSSLISGNWGFGFVSAKVAMDLAIKKARDQNIAVAAIVQTGHIGRLGEYVEMAAREGMISFVFADSRGIFTIKSPAFTWSPSLTLIYAPAGRI